MQAALQGILTPLSEQLIAWLDDLLLHATTDSLMLAHMRTFFTICREYNLKLHPAKCTLFANLVRWCERLVSGSGVRFDPRRIQGLLEMSAPQTGADLQQFLCALNWMRTAIPSFAELVSPLQRLLELAYQQSGGRRTKTAVAKVSLKQIGWYDQHATALESCKEALKRAAKLALFS
jgi:hypothetical protein